MVCLRLHAQSHHQKVTQNGKPLVTKHWQYGSLISPASVLSMLVTCPALPSRPTCPACCALPVTSHMPCPLRPMRPAVTPHPSCPTCPAHHVSPILCNNNNNCYKLTGQSQTQVILTRFGGVCIGMAWLCMDQVHAHTLHALTSLSTPFPMLRLQTLTLFHMPQLFSKKPWSRMPWCASSDCPPSEPKLMTTMMMSTLLDVFASCMCTASPCQPWPHGSTESTCSR